MILPRNGDSSRMLWGKAALLYGRQGEVAGAFESIREITELRVPMGRGYLRKK